jgi:hypothetical protein
MTNATRHLIKAIEANQANSDGKSNKTKFILMGTEGVPNPADGGHSYESQCGKKYG